jgi:hypothetical protein
MNALAGETCVVTNNTKQGLIVIGVSVVLGFFVVGVPYLAHQASLQAISVLRADCERSLDMSYRSIFISETNSSPRSVPFEVGPAELVAKFCDTNQGTTKFTSLVPWDAIWIAKNPVQMPSSNLLCVIRFEKMYYGVDGYGVRISAPIIENEFVKWPHMSAKELVTGQAHKP